MGRLIALEIRKHNLRPYHLAALAGGCTMLVFQYFMAAIPLIDPADPDIGLFSSYEFLFGLNHLMSMAYFSVMGGVLGARFVVEEYSGAKALLTFSYPVCRRKVLKAKLFLVLFYTTLAMIVWGIFTGLTFAATERIFPFCKEPLTFETILWVFVSLLLYALSTGGTVSLSLWFGLGKQSTSATIVASIVLAVLLCQVFSSVLTFRFILFILTGLLFIAAFGAVRSLYGQVEKMEV